jgi:hypothetical protein
MAILYILLAFLVAAFSGLPASAGAPTPKPSVASAGTAAGQKPQFTKFIGQAKSVVFKHFTKEDPNWDFQFWKNFAEGEQSFADSTTDVQFVFDKDKVTMVRSSVVPGQQSNDAVPPYGPWMDAKGAIKTQPKISVPKDKPEQVTKNGIDLNAYMAEVISRLKKNFHPSKPGVGPIVSITIDQNGKVQPNSTGIFKKSGDPGIDKQAIEALKTTTSYPPLGPGWKMVHFGCQLNMANWTWPH